MKKNIFFINNKKINVDIKKNLLKFINPTANGTNYFDPPPNKPLNKFQKFRIIFQIHQFFDLMKSINFKFKNKRLLDVGGGNGMVARLIANFSNIHSFDVTDPYGDAEHTTSWQKHDRNKLFDELKYFIIKNKFKLDMKDYIKYTDQEDYSLLPKEIKFLHNKEKKFKFYSYRAEDLNKLKRKYDLIYCKAVEHISNLPRIVKNFSTVSKKGSIVYFKHRSFFSYLGPHRYASTGIPWGHVILSDSEYKNYVSRFHKNRKKEMINFYFSEISYPRFTIHDLVSEFLKKDFEPLLVFNENADYKNKFKRKDIDLVLKNWKLIKKRYPNLSIEEVMSGIYHILFRKV